MECVLEAQPLPDIKWFQGSKQINLTERIKMTKKDLGKDSYLLSLEISSPTINDGGNWRCNAVNAFGESNANIALNFQGRASSVLPHKLQTYTHPGLPTEYSSLVQRPF